MAIKPGKWRDKIPTETISLPSGAEVVVRKNKLRILLSRNILPLISQNGKNPPADGEGTRDHGEFVRAFIQACEIVCQTVVEPQIVMEQPQNEDAVWIQDIPEDDLMALVTYVMGGGVSDAATFRNERVGDRTGSHGEPIPPAAVQTDGD